MNLLLGQGSELIDLAQARARLCGQHDPNDDVLLRHYGGVEQTVLNFSAIVRMNMSEFMAPYDDLAACCLAHLELYFRDRSSIHGVAWTDVDDLLLQTRELIDAIRAATI
jgi:hypothetical protein